MEWGSITVTDRTPIIVCKKGVAGHHVRRTTYRHPLARRVGRRLVFQDNTRAHRVRIVNAHLQQHNIYQMSWPAMSPDLPPIRAGFRTGQAGQLPMGLDNLEASTYFLSHFIFGYSRVGWASITPLLKAA